MKKFLLKAFMLLCLILWGGVSSAWAEKTYTKVTDASTLAANDVIILACDSKSTYAGAMGSNSYLSSVSEKANAIEITLGESDGKWTLTTSEGTIGATADKKMSKTGGTTTWTISISSGNATITSTTTSYGSIQYNASSPRFLNYSSSQTAVQIYKVSEGGDTPGGDEPGGDEPGGDTPTPSAVGTYLYVVTPLANITSSDEVVMVWTNKSGSYGITSGNGASSAPTAVAVEIENGMFVTDKADIVWNVDYSDGKLTIYPNGTTEKWLYCTASNNGVRVGINTNKTFVIDANYLQNEETSRYLGIYNNSDIRCYTSINSNIEDQTLAFYVKKGVQTTISAAGYATFFDSEHAYVMPDDCAGYVFTAANGLELAYDAEDVVPAGEPLVLYTIEPGTKTLVFTTSTKETLKSAGLNDLDGTDEETALEADVNSYFYGLSLNAENELSSVGFYWMNETGAAFTNGAHKAYLKLPKTSGARSGFAFNEETEALESIEMNAATTIYTLNGVKVNELQKGLNIVNGKKVMVK